MTHYVEWARQAVDLSGFFQLGIDEFSIRKGHVDMTLFGDLEESRVISNRFHVMNQINKALEAVRQVEQRENAEPKNSRFLWLKNPKNLTTRQEAKLAELKQLDLRTAQAYQIKLALRAFRRLPIREKR